MPAPWLLALQFALRAAGLIPLVVTPAKAGVQDHTAGRALGLWISAFAGTTN